MAETARDLQVSDLQRNVKIVDFTEMQQAFISNYLDGLNQTEAARRAGYSNPEQAGWQQLRKAHIAHFIRTEQARKLATDGVRVGINTLLEIAQDREAPKAARVQAANSLLDRAGLTARVAEAAQGVHDRPLSEMTIHELQAVVSQERERLANADAIEGEAVPLLNDGREGSGDDD